MERKGQAQRGAGKASEGWKAVGGKNLNRHEMWRLKTKIIGLPYLMAFAQTS